MKTAMIYDLAIAAAMDAGNRRARRFGRETWNNVDYESALLEFHRLWPCPSDVGCELCARIREKETTSMKDDNLPERRMRSLLPGRIQHENAPVRVYPSRGDAVSYRDAPPPWRVPAGPNTPGMVRPLDCPNPPAPREARPRAAESGEWFLAVAVHYHTDYSDDEPCEEGCYDLEKGHLHVREHVSHFEFAFTEAYPSEKEAEAALERFAKENGHPSIEDFVMDYGCGEGGWLTEVRPVMLGGKPAVDDSKFQNAWKLRDK